MSSGSILPTFGAAPPNIRRVSIPRELQPDVPNAADAVRARGQTPEGAPEQTFGQSAQTDGSRTVFGRPIIAGDAAVLAPRATDSQPSFVAPPKPVSAPPPSEASRRFERLIREAAEPDEGVNAQGLTEEEQAYVEELKAIDREVRAHEAAHAAKGGGYAGRPTYEYVTGPDGVRYAVSGRVQIDTGVVAGDPEATIRKLETVRRAALAPAKPSGQDRAVAAQAEAAIRQAQAELREKRTEETREQLGDEPAEADTGTPSISEQIAESREGSSDSSPDSSSGDSPNDRGEPSFAANLVAQQAFSQAAFNQSAGLNRQDDAGTGLDVRAGLDIRAGLDLIV